MISSRSRQAALAQRIAKGFEGGGYAVVGLLRLLDIVETTAVPTAAVQCLTQPRLLINPEFVERYADTPQKLQMLVLHELHHVLLGHTTLFPQATTGQNLVFDAVINGLLCRMYPDPAYTALFTGFYRDDHFPECLLRPPTGWSLRVRPADFPIVAGLRSLPESLQSRAREVHAALYSPAGASYYEVEQLLPGLLEQGLGEGTTLLGSHAEGETAGMGAQITAIARDLAHAVLKQLPQPMNPLKDCSLDHLLQQRQVQSRRPASSRSRLRQLIRQVAGRAGATSAVTGGREQLAIQTAVPGLSRRSAVLHALGVPVLLHVAQSPWQRIRREGERVHIYLDVSGSMNSVLPALYGAAQDCEDLLCPAIHLFSTTVVDITRAQLHAGHCSSTGGTCISAVTEHMARHRVSRAVIVTDGLVGQPDTEQRRILEQVELAVAFLGNHINQSSLGGLARHSVILNSGASL
jgi:hypothetical protein